MVGAPRLLAQAIGAGLVSADDVLDGLVAVAVRSRSNVVHRISRAGRPVAYVKERGAASLLDGDDVVALEGAALRALSGLDRVCDALPLGAGTALWTRAVAGTPLGEALPADPGQACRAWGAALAPLHRWPVRADGHAGAPPPWAADAAAPPPSMRGCPDDAPGGRVLAAARREAPLRAAAAHVRRRWRPLGWIHGDLSAANVLVDGARRPADVRFVDLEHSGLGPPEWDVATALDTIAALAPGWGASARRLGGAFLAGYRRAGGPGRVNPCFQAVRALTTAWQESWTPDGAARADGAAAAGASLARARGFAGRARRPAAVELVA